MEGDYISDPLGWGGREGDLGLRNMELSFGALKGAGIKELTNENIDATMTKIRQEAKQCRTWGKVYYAYGTKPEI